MDKLKLDGATVFVGDCIQRMKEMPAGSVQMCVTSPPYYGLRDYGHDGQIGLEETPEAYIAKMVEVFHEVRRVLADDGTLWLNIGDSYARPPAKGGSGPGGKNREWYGESYGQARGAEIPPGCKPKDLIGIPWMLAFALRADGWYLRQDIIWHKPNPMPESVKDRCTKAHEYVFLLSKSERYFYDSDAIKEPAAQSSIERSKYGYNHAFKNQFKGSATDEWNQDGKKLDAGAFSTEMRNKRSVWNVATRPYKGAHFAVFPPSLIEPCILAGSRTGDVVLDPFNGSGTTGQVALQHGRRYVGVEINSEYVELTRQRLESVIAARKTAAEPEPQIDLFAA